MNELPLDAGPWPQAESWHSRASGTGAQAPSWLQVVLSGEDACFIEVLSSLPQIVDIPAANWLRDSRALAWSDQSHRPYVAGWK